MILNRLPTFRYCFRRYAELCTWIIALCVLGVSDPSAGTDHYELCVFKLLGIPFCPGCGLGHSISWLFRGEVQQSFASHPLGIFAVVILFHRIYTLIKNRFSFLTA